MRFVRAGIVALAVAAGAFVGWSSGGVEYRAEATLEAVVRPETILYHVGEGRTGAALRAAGTRAASLTTQIGSRRVIDLVVRDARWSGDLDPGAFAQRLATRSRPNQGLVEVAFEHPDPETARMAVELLTQHTMRLDAAADQANAGLIRGLEAQRDEVAARLERLREEQRAATDGLGFESLKTRVELVRSTIEELRARREELELLAGSLGTATPAEIGTRRDALSAVIDEREAERAALLAKLEGGQERADDIVRLASTLKALDGRLGTPDLRAVFEHGPNVRLLDGATVGSSPCRDDRPGLAVAGGFIALVLAGGATLTVGRARRSR